MARFDKWLDPPGILGLPLMEVLCNFEQKFCWDLRKQTKKQTDFSENNKSNSSMIMSSARVLLINNESWSKVWRFASVATFEWICFPWIQLINLSKSSRNYPLTEQWLLGNTEGWWRINLLCCAGGRTLCRFSASDSFPHGIDKGYSTWNRLVSR